MGKKPGIPGMHGVKRMGKLTEYAKQLREKQKARHMYGLSEKQFHNTYVTATRMKGVIGDNFLQCLERRLDNVLYRAGFALTRMQARQFISHGLFMFNGRRIDVPSVEVRVGDVIQIREKSKGSSVFAKNMEELGDHFQAPSWLQVDTKSLKVEIVDLPSPQHFEQLINPQMIVEFYSR